MKIGTYDEVELTNGSQGMKRIDLIVNRYTRNTETEIEKNEWKVIVGTPHENNPVAPAYTVGNLQKGDLVDECPVFAVYYNGINVVEVKKLLSVNQTNKDLGDKVVELRNLLIYLSRTLRKKKKLLKHLQVLQMRQRRIWISQLRMQMWQRQHWIRQSSLQMIRTHRWAKRSRHQSS